MKWPIQLTLIRHAASAYNALKVSMQADPQYQEFVSAYQRQPADPQTREMAGTLHQRYPVEIGDCNTPLASGALLHAHQVGQALPGQITLPDIIYVSPYLRTQATLSALCQAWPELAHVRVISEERIREQEFGLRLLYSDWRLFFALHPEQQQLHKVTGSYWYRYPQGENVPDVRERNRSWMNTLTRDFSGLHILAITHHINILALRANMERLSEQDFLLLDRSQKPQNCSITTYLGDPNQGKEGRLILDQYNQQLA